MLESDWLADTRTSYDTVAVSYAALLRDALDEQPVVRHLLALFAETVHRAECCIGYDPCIGTEGGPS